MWLRYMALIALVLAPVLTWPATAGALGGRAAAGRWALRIVVWAGAAAGLWLVVLPWSREMLAAGHSSDPYGAPVPLAVALSAGLAAMRVRAALRRPD
ncbi:MAG TPA: hypothetical protein VFE30_01835 [Anaeromyxobacteraceae bacterium]|jgi:hypothetical protein|nr:hypothetical protein [Anaeromyxobacteraceae bacterium]